jgi:transposase
MNYNELSDDTTCSHCGHEASEKELLENDGWCPNCGH